MMILTYVMWIIDWTVIILMTVLPNVIHDYRIVFIVSFSISLVLLALNAIRYYYQDIVIYPKVLELGLVIINLAIMIF